MSNVDQQWVKREQSKRRTLILMLRAYRGHSEEEAEELVWKLTPRQIKRYCKRRTIKIQAIRTDPNGELVMPIKPEDFAPRL